MDNHIRETISPELAKQIRDLSGTANNVNQIAHKANAAGYMEAHGDCLAMNERLDKIIKRIEDDC